jgi:hypothetical protein
MLRASRRELERAYRSHKRLAASQDAPQGFSNHLLVAYAVECGLKAALMRRRRVEDTAQLGSMNFGHDLREFLKNLNVPANLSVSDGLTDQQEPQTIQPKQIHEALRYGISFQQGVRVETELCAVMEWLRGELS